MRFTGCAMQSLQEIYDKYRESASIENEIFIFIDRVLENVFALHRRQQELVDQLESFSHAKGPAIRCQRTSRPNSFSSDESPPSSPKRKRKARSFDSPVSMRKENLIQNKSDTDKSLSFLNQNVEAPDTEDSFFALTQSPKAPVTTMRLALSPKLVHPNVLLNTPKRSWLKNQQESKLQLQKEIDRKKNQNIICLDINRSKTTLPLEDLEVKASPVRLLNKSKTSVKQETAVAHVDESTVAPKAEERKKVMHVPLKLRQAKLVLGESSCYEQNHKAPEENDTLCEDFVVPTPPSLSKSNFMKSARRKIQSSLVGPKAPKRSSDDNFFDIDQTYCSGAESRLHRPVAIKMEPPDKTRTTVMGKPFIKEREEVQLDSDSVVLVKPAKQNTVVTVTDSSEPNSNDIFMAEVERQLQEMDDYPSPSRTRSTPAIRNPLGAAREKCALDERMCSECSQHYRYLLDRGLTSDLAVSKLPSNCRSCRIARLHSTPPGFWNPEFSPTQRT